MTPLRVRIDGTDLPGSSCGPSSDEPGGYHDIHVGIQRRGKRDELLGLTAGDAVSASWSLDCTAIRTETGFDVRGPHIQGPPDGRFIYLSWVHGSDGHFRLFRRAKLWLDGVPPGVIGAAIDGGVLVGRLILTDDNGNPTCTAGQPPTIQWSAESAQ